MFLKIIKNRILLAFLLSCIVVSVLIVFSPFLHVLNKNLQNQYYSLRNSIFHREVNTNIAVVVIDEKTLSGLGRFPFSREIYAEIIQNLTEKEVATIAFDILFFDESIPENDDLFIKSIKNTPIPVIFGSAITSEYNLEGPHNMFLDVISGTGFLPLNIDTTNGRVYSFSPVLSFGESLYEHFAIVTLRQFYTYLWNVDIVDNTLEIPVGSSYSIADYVNIPLSSYGANDILISFIPSEEFQQVSFIDLYQNKIPKDVELRDSIVLIGPAADGLKDELFTPFGLEYGVFAHANILNTVLTKNYLMYFDKKLEWILLFLLIITSVYFNLGYSKKELILSNLLIAVFFLFFIPIGIFLFTNLLMNYPIEILLALIVSQSLSNGVKYLIEDTNKQKLKKSLSEYVGSHIAEEVLEEAGKINFDGEEKKTILFFSDIEGFTSISERLEAKKLVGFLREYLSQMSHIILDAKGYINKYEGDAIMAIWGAFSHLDSSDYTSVCRASLEQLRLLKQLNRDWLEHYGEEINIRIGIHAGDVIVGNIGAQGRKMEFTALGDTVNIASRLEGVNKFYGTYACVSEEVYKETSQDFEYRFLDMITVKGKKESLKIYELLSEKGGLTEDQKEINTKFSKALNLYFRQDFQKAKMLFSELIELGDKPSLTFKSRCSLYLLEAPTEDWDGVWNMESK